MPGRKRTPTAIKRANGNPGKRKLNDDEPQPAKGKPKAPAHLSALARTHWHATLRVLFPTGVITLAEADLLALYCESWARWRQAKDEIRPRVGKEGLRTGGMFLMDDKGMLKRHPALGVIAESEKAMMRCLSELGMTPSARARLTVGDKVGDALDKFLSDD